MGAREGSTDLLDKLNEAIALMKADGSLNELIPKWGVRTPGPSMGSGDRFPRR